jgi:hypothetical protein
MEGDLDYFWVFRRTDVVCHARKADRTNSTFSFCQRESQRRKTKRAIFCQRWTAIKENEKAEI